MSSKLVKHKNWVTVNRGDIVDVIAPGYPSPLHEVRDGLLYLKKIGLNGRAPKNIIQKHFLHANSDEKRWQFLKAAIESQDSKVIWCTRGGYGSNRLLPYLQKMKKPKKSKLLIGLSDVTSLHTFLNQEWGWSTLHACVLDRLGRGQLPFELEVELQDVIFGKTSEIEFKQLIALNSAAKNTKKINSSVVGGNLTVLQSGLGTAFQINADKKLLFVEDIGERGYRIDRMFEQFRQAGIFKKCHGILLGHFIGGNEPGSDKNNFDKVFARWANDLDIPMWSGVEAGHDTFQRALPLNTSCQLVADGKKHTLIVSTGGEKND